MTQLDYMGCGGLSRVYRTTIVIFWALFADLYVLPSGIAFSVRPGSPHRGLRRLLRRKIAMIKFSTSAKFAVLSAALLLAACTHKQEAVNTAPPPAPPPPPMAQAAPPVTSSIIPGSAQDFKVNVGDTVHFGYNEYSIQDTDKGTLGKQAAWLSRYPSVKLTIEGHCDERGTREYNLALGARRANAVKEYLVAQGVAAGRLETVSYGKERPLCTESNEDCWAQNRRGVSVISGGANS
jgi:peptidoglycan-associated lipoprotein